jgi:hypothetical protein
MPFHVYLSRRMFTGEDCPVSSSEGDATALALGQQRRPRDANMGWASGGVASVGSQATTC